MLPSLTLVIPAYNEEKYIKRCIESILRQKAGNHILEKILIIADGCTDKTIECINDFNNKKIEIIEQPSNLGVSEAINTALQHVKSDYLIKTDGDTEFSDDHGLEKLLQKSIDSDAALVFGQQNYRKPDGSLLQRYIFTVHGKTYKQHLLPYLKGENYLQHHITGLYLLRRDAYQKITIPPDVVSEDVYIFYQTKNKGFVTSYCPEPVQYFNYSESWKHHLKQILRWDSPAVSNHFSKEFLLSYNQPFPKMILYPVLLQLFFRHPFYFLILLLTRATVVIRSPFYTNKRNWGGEN